MWHRDNRYGTIVMSGIDLAELAREAFGISGSIGLADLATRFLGVFVNKAQGMRYFFLRVKFMQGTRYFLLSHIYASYALLSFSVLLSVTFYSESNLCADDGQWKGPGHSNCSTLIFAQTSGAPTGRRRR